MSDIDINMRAALLELIPTRLQLDTSPMDQFSQLSHPDIRAIGMNFQDSIEDTISTLMHSVFLLHGGILFQHAVKLYLQQEKALPFGEAYAEITYLIEQIRASNSSIPLEDTENALVNILGRIADIRKVMVALFASSISQVYTAFEVLEKELKDVIKTKHSDFESLYKKSKQENKFRRIEQAYSAIKKSDKLVEVFSDAILIEIQATRNVLLHAGKIDAEYNKRTGSSLPIGSKIALNVENVSKFINFIIVAVSVLVEHANVIMEEAV